MLIYACKKNYQDFVRYALASTRANTSAQDSEALIVAASGSLDVVIDLLLRDGRADPKARDSKVLQLISDNYNYNGITANANPVRSMLLLLRDGRSNPAAQNNEAFIRACVTKNWDLIQTLGLDPRVDVNAQDGLALL